VRKFFCDKALIRLQRNSPMPTQCSPDLFGYEVVEGRRWAPRSTVAR
jgi:hypothetical protein